ncbi:MAG TPA: bifunctional nuclease family protein [Myxococcota bacterium]|nr:bifunctional nuclease family protein [Myxococcota bacterium]
MTRFPRTHSNVWVVLALAAAFACSGDRSSDHDVAVRVGRVGLDANDMPVVLLEEREGKRWLAIWIGSAEAQSIAMSIDEVASPRPNTHDLARSVIDGLHGKIERVVVTDLKEGTYYATLALRADGRRVEIDARPSDAIAIALRASAPIFVRDHLFEHSEISDDDRPPAPSI